jgi:hypothetical protein
VAPRPAQTATCRDLRTEAAQPPAHGPIDPRPGPAPGPREQFLGVSAQRPASSTSTWTGTTCCPPSTTWIPAIFRRTSSPAARGDGITLVTPTLLDHSPQVRAADGFEKNAFTVNWTTRQVTCPAGATSINWSPARQHGRDAIVVKFGADACDTCPFRARCTTSARGRRQLTLHPKELHEALATARAEQKSETWKEKYKLRAGVEGTINQAITVTGIRHARYRGLPKVRLQHTFSALAIDLIRLDAWWSDHPLDRGRTSNLTRLHHRLAA